MRKCELSHGAQILKISTQRKLTSLNSRLLYTYQALYASILVSSNIDDTLSNAEQLMVLRDYRTAAALFTVAQKRLADLASHQAVADLLCKRAECLLLMVS